MSSTCHYSSYLTVKSVSSVDGLLDEESLQVPDRVRRTTNDDDNLEHAEPHEHALQRLLRSFVVVLEFSLFILQTERVIQLSVDFVEALLDWCKVALSQASI